ncbi:hypothetical protein GCM10009080_15050 [Cupriavidus pauculus]
MARGAWSIQGAPGWREVAGKRLAQLGKRELRESVRKRVERRAGHSVAIVDGLPPPEERQRIGIVT